MVLLFFSSMVCCFSHGDNHDFGCFFLRDNHGFVVYL